MVRRFHSCCQGFVLNVLQFCEEEKKQGRTLITLGRVWDRVCKMLNISRQTLNNLRKAEELLPPGEGGSAQRGFSFTEEDIANVRPAIAEMVSKKMTVNTQSLQIYMEEHFGWKWSRTTLWRVLRHVLGFNYVGKRDIYYEKLRDDPVNSMHRAKYLHQYLIFHSQGRPFVYQDETWIDKNITPSRTWFDFSERDVSTYEDFRIGKGERYIVIGAGTKDGWLLDTVKLWLGKRKTGQYKGEMNSDRFKQWWDEALIPALESNNLKNAVIVLDRATYHLEKTEDCKRPQQAWTREELAVYILKHKGKDEDGRVLTEQCLLRDEQVSPAGRKTMGFNKTMMYAYALSSAPKETRYKWQDWVEAQNKQPGWDIRVLILPVAHPRLNPIEIQWADLKNYVRDKNKDFSLGKIEGLAKQKLNDMQTDGSWAKAVANSQKYIRIFWRMDEELLLQEEKDAAGSGSKSKKKKKDTTPREDDVDCDGGLAYL